MREPRTADALDAIPASEWVKAILAVIATVGITILLPLAILISSLSCGCETRPA